VNGPLVAVLAIALLALAALAVVTVTAALGSSKASRDEGSNPLRDASQDDGAAP